MAVKPPTRNLTQAAAAAALSMLCLTTCSGSSSALDVKFLASDIYFMIGGHHITVPAIAIRGPDHTFDLGAYSRPKKSLKDTLTSEASDPAHPMKVDSLDLIVREYQLSGERLDSSEMCPLLTRDWSRAVCRGQQHGLLRRLPEKVDLLDRARLDVLKDHWTVGKEREYDQVKNMAMRPGVTEIGCDRDARFCTALVEVLPGLLAVWTVWSDEKSGGTAAEMADTQGVAIVQFVRRALGSAEDSTLVYAD
jgi:hypothetical protein